MVMLKMCQEKRGENVKMLQETPDHVYYFVLYPLDINNESTRHC